MMQMDREMYAATDRDRKLDQLLALTEKLESTERFFDMFLHQSPFCMWCKDYTYGEGRMLFISDMYAEIFGVTECDYIGRTDRDVWPETVAAVFRRQDMEVIEKGRSVYSIEPTPLAKLPEWKRCHTLKFPLKNEEGKVVAVGGIAWPELNVGQI